jgi:hypothetical protein
LASESEPFADDLVVGPKLRRPLKCRTRVVLLAKPKVTPAHAHLELVRVWRGEAACPEVVVDGDTIRIGEDANATVLKKDEWNVLVDLIQSRQLGRL